MAIKRRRPNQEEADIIGGRVAVHLAAGRCELAERVLQGFIQELQSREHWADGYDRADELPLGLTELPAAITTRLEGYQVFTVGDYRRGNPAQWKGLGRHRAVMAKQAVEALVSAFHSRKTRQRKAGDVSE